MGDAAVADGENAAIAHVGGKIIKVLIKFMIYPGGEIRHSWGCGC